MATKKLSFFYRQSTKRLLWVLLIASCIGPILLELGLHRHSHFAKEGLHAIDGGFMFYAGLGFIGCAAMIIVAKAMGVFFKVKEDYYDN